MPAIEYEKENMCKFQFKVNKKTEAELLAFIKRQNKGFVKNLVKQKMEEEKNLPMEIKRLLTNKEIEVVRIKGRWFALFGWNGIDYSECWETKEDTTPIECDNKTYTLTPVSQGVGEPDEDGLYDDYEIVDYLVEENK